MYDIEERSNYLNFIVRSTESLTHGWFDDFKSLDWLIKVPSKGIYFPSDLKVSSPCILPVYKLLLLWKEYFIGFMSHVHMCFI